MMRFNCNGCRLLYLFIQITKQKHIQVYSTNKVNFKIYEAPYIEHIVKLLYRVFAYGQGHEFQDQILKMAFSYHPGNIVLKL